MARSPSKGLSPGRGYQAGIPIHDLVREGWADTGAYRAYDRWIRLKRRDDAKRVASSRVPAYGTQGFNDRAQRFWIQSRLGMMQNNRTAHHSMDPADLTTLDSWR